MSGRGRGVENPRRRRRPARRTARGTAFLNARTTKGNHKAITEQSRGNGNATGRGPSAVPVGDLPPPRGAPPATERGTASPSKGDGGGVRRARTPYEGRRREYANH
ncbi:hypothetical protein GCM10017688_40480 [Streptomyces ramulosus]